MPSALALKLCHRHYPSHSHPYRVFERAVDEALKGHPNATLMDAGCGRTAPVLRTYAGKANRLIGVEFVDFRDIPPEIETYRCDLARIPIPDASVDVVMSRSVFEHLVEPAAVYAELMRVLKPGGRLIFLTANKWDYGTMVARLTPNKLHPWIIKRVEGRPEEDTFPTAYKTNSRSDIARLSKAAGLRVERFEYLSQYPNYLLFNAAAFVIGMAYEKFITNIKALNFLQGWILVTLRKPAD